MEGKASTDAGVFLQLISTEPKSLQVVIDKLERAKAQLEEKLLEI